MGAGARIPRWPLLLPRAPWAQTAQSDGTGTTRPRESSIHAQVGKGKALPGCGGYMARRGARRARSHRPCSRIASRAVAARFARMGPDFFLLLCRVQPRTYVRDAFAVPRLDLTSRYWSIERVRVAISHAHMCRTAR